MKERHWVSDAERQTICTSAAREQSALDFAVCDCVCDMGQGKTGFISKLGHTIMESFNSIFSPFGFTSQ